MANQMGNFSPQLSEMTQPLRELLAAKRVWTWGKRAFTQVKQELSQPTVLELYDPFADTVLSADASSYGLGAMLLDGQHHNQMEASSLASRSISDTEH